MRPRLLLRFVITGTRSQLCQPHKPPEMGIIEAHLPLYAVFTHRRTALLYACHSDSSTAKNTLMASTRAAHTSSAYLSADAYRARSPFVRISPGSGFSQGTSSASGGGSIFTVSEHVAHAVRQWAHKPITVNGINLFDTIHMFASRLLHGFCRP